MNHLKDKIKEARLAKGWSRAQLAREAELSDRTVARAEKGEIINELSRSKLAKALNKKSEELFMFIQ